jgi:hypothetical protein
MSHKITRKVKRGKLKPRFTDYEKIDTENVVTFGTSVFIRKDRQALIILFPTGSQLHFKPELEINLLKESNHAK